MHKKYIKEIIEKGNQKDMELLEHVFDKSMEHLEECNREMYDKLEDELYIALYGYKLTECKAKDIIDNMKPRGCKWSLEQSKNTQSEYELNNIRDVDFWIVINSAYNDYFKMFDEDIEKYVEYTKLFIMDEDSKEDKVFLYFTQIPKKED